MRGAFALDGDTAAWVGPDEARALASVPAGTPFTVPPVLFAKITEDDLDSYRERFGGDPDQ
jgi:methionyl-tRNA synthetase